MNQPIPMLTGYRFDNLLGSALSAAVPSRKLIQRVDLRFPEYMPAAIMDTDLDSAVISRFRS